MNDPVSVSSIDTAEHPAPVVSFDWQRAHAELLELARDQAALDTQIGRWLLYAARAVTHAWLGYASIGEYAGRLFGFTPRQTQERLRVAEALEQLPALANALEHGELCWSAVRELTRVATPETEADWLATAQGRTAHQVEAMVAGHARGDHPHDPANSESLRRVLRFELSAEAYATVQEALTQIRRRAGGRLDDEQALLLMARQALGGPTDDGRSSYQVAISVCPSCERGFQHARGELVELGAAAVEKACCDAQLIGSMRDAATHVGTESGDASRRASSASAGVRRRQARGHARGRAQRAAGAHEQAATDERAGADVQARERAQAREGVQAGGDRFSLRPTPSARATQTIPPRIRRLVLRRAQHRCEVDGCTNSTFLDVHHWRPRSEGGGHHPNGLIALCAAHHSAVHDGRLLVEGDAARGWMFRHADGAVYGAASAAPQVDVAVKVFRGRCTLGFKQGDARRAVDEVLRRAKTHARADTNCETLLRESLGMLAPHTTAPPHIA